MKFPDQKCQYYTKSSAKYGTLKKVIMPPRVHPHLERKNGITIGRRGAFDGGFILVRPQNSFTIRMVLNVETSQLLFRLGVGGTLLEGCLIQKQYGR